LHVFKIEYENSQNIVALDSSTEYTQICKHNLISRDFDNVKNKKIKPENRNNEKENRGQLWGDDLVFPKF
jgi:hypothetical protein